MKIHYLLVLVALIAVPLFAGQISLGPQNNATRAEPVKPVLERASDTLKYDTEGFNDGLGLYSSTGQTTPSGDTTWGFAFYFILSEFGLENKKAVSVLLNFFTVKHPEYDFRLYVWNNEGSILSPQSQGTPLYKNPEAKLPAEKTWEAYDLSAEDIALPDTFWVGVCNNHFAASTADTDWYLAMNTTQSDEHGFCDDPDDAIEWFPMADLSRNHPYAVRVVVEDNATPVFEKNILTNTGTLFYAPTVSSGNIAIELSLTEATNVDVSVYDAMGKQ